jgi:ADP-heptose:LPS heptosyltransferase
MPAADSVVGWHWAMGRELARAAGAAAAWPDEIPPPDLRHLITAAEKRGARPRVVVHAGSSRGLNRWPAGRFAAVANGLARDAEVVWVERPETAGAATDPAVRRVAAADLRGLASLLAGADLFLGNNSGPMHVAVALGRPGVAVTGPSAIGWDPFWHRERWRVLRHPALACAPCERPNKVTPACANTAAPLACLDYWSAAAVEAECRAWLERWR